MLFIVEILGLCVCDAALNCALNKQVKEYKVPFSLRFALFSLTALALTGGLNAHAEEQILKVGVTTGPHEEIFEAVKKVAEREYGLHIRIVAFSDYIQPDAALDAGDIDANSFQHRPFLAAQIRARGYKLTGVGRTWIGPSGIYSKNYKQFSALPDGASIGIPNDPANESRTLLLLQKAGAITLRSGIDPITGINATPRDITSNPKHFKFTEIDAAQLPRTLDDFDATTINADYAIKAALNPGHDTILVEDAGGPYACLIKGSAGSNLPLQGDSEFGRGRCSPSKFS